jgi:phosphoglycerate dehydrogenase-like enzyme
MNILITPKSYQNYKDTMFPLLQNQGYDMIVNNTGRTLTEDEIIEMAGDDVVGMIVGIDPLPVRVLKSCKKLRAVSKYGVGLDNIDLQAAAALGIKVASAVGSNNISVAELAIALLFESARHVSAMNAGVKNGGWTRVPGIELTGKTLGVVGGGQIGKEVAKRARGLCMDVLLYDPYYRDYEFLNQHGIIRCEKLEQVLELADAVSLHLPLTPETKHMINADTLKLMKPTAALINTSRGELVDESSLYDALKNQRLAFAAQDVLSIEPPPPDHELLTLDNFILTPHTGAFTAEGVERMALYSTRNLIDLLNDN